MTEQAKKKTEIEQTNPAIETTSPAPGSTNTNIEPTDRNTLLGTTAPFVTPSSTEQTIPPETAEQLDADEEEFKKIRRDLPGIKGSSAIGIVSISVGRAPSKNEFFRVHPTFLPVVPIVNCEIGMEKQFFAVTNEMVKALADIGITVSDHVLYLTITSGGTLRVIPVRQPDDESGDTRNEWDRSKETGLISGVKEWVRFYTDKPNSRYRVFPAPERRFEEPKFPDLSHAKIFKLSFRARGHLIDSPEHALFKKWAARDTNNDK
jgi:hypothetical protein